MGVWELVPLMSRTTSTECSVLLPAVVQSSKEEEAGLNGEGCGQHNPTAALGHLSHSTAVGQTNCNECQTHSACWWSSLILKACIRDTTFGGEMVCAGGISSQNSEYQKMDDFTVRDYFVSFHPTLPRAIYFICLPICLSLGFHEEQTKCFIRQPIRAGGLDIRLIVVIWPTPSVAANRN